MLKESQILTHVDVHVVLIVVVVSLAEPVGVAVPVTLGNPSQSVASAVGLVTE